MPLSLPVTDAPRRAARGQPRASDLRWRLIQDVLRPGAENMALDHALAACLADGEGVVRLYGWIRPTVSFGKNEPASRLMGDVDVDYVRRPTGGRAVLHAAELTYAVVAPLDAFGGLRAAYVRINEILATAMRSLGAAVDLASDGVTALAPDAGPCFRTPAPGELVARGRKLVGSAQARLEGALLQHGSILLAGDQGPLGGGDSMVAPVTPSELLAAVDLDTVTGATAEGFRTGLGGRWESDGFKAAELEAAKRLAAQRYGQDTWTWRR
jgi:lipoate-protein ligase A